MKNRLLIRTTLLLLSLLMLAASLYGCQSATPAAPAQTAPAATAAPSAAAAEPAATPEATASVKDTLPVLKVPAGDWVYIANQKGWLQEAFKEFGFEIEIVEGALGNEVQLFERGDLHFAGRMIYPVLLYKSQGAAVSVVEVSQHPAPDIVSILVAKDSPIQTFDDLKGKKIASWRAGCPYMVLYELAENRGWVQGTDWEYINIPSSENKTALLSGEVDAISCHQIGDVAALLTEGLAREVANTTEDSVYVQGGGVTVTFAPTEFANQYPEVVKAYVDLQHETNAWIKANYDEAAGIVESVTRTPVAITQFWWSRSDDTWTPELSLSKIKEETNRTIDWLIAHGDIEADKRPDTESLFAAQYFEQ